MGTTSGGGWPMGIIQRARAACGNDLGYMGSSSMLVHGNYPDHGKVLVAVSMSCYNAHTEA